METANTPRTRRTERQLEADRLTDETLRRIGRAARLARKRRRLTQAELGGRLGISQSEVSRLELGRGDGAPIRTWLALAVELGLRPTFELGRDVREEPVDAGHLAVQELLLRLARATGATGTFELPIRPSDPSHSIDVFVRDDARRRLIVEEAWNTLGDIGAGARSFARKLAAAQELAVAIGGERPYDVRGVWVIRATRRNRTIVARYPEVFAGHFRGSSLAWAAALTSGSSPPAEPGLVWCDVAATRIFPWRRADQSMTIALRSSAGSG